MSNNVLFEIGIEELPARFIDKAERQLKDKTEKWLADAHIEHGEIKTFSTPRRLAIQILDIDERQTTIAEEVRGPQVKIAKDDEGNWTKAAIGFTKGQGKNLEDIYIKEVKGISYIFVEKRMEAKRTEEIMPEFATIISAISFPQTMRWGSDSFRFARPIRWLAALFNNELIPFEVARIKTSNITYGHRFLGEKSVIGDALEYESILENNYVIPNPKKREKMILEQIEALEKEEGFHIAVNQELLQEVRNLVEYPTVFFGQFEENYLSLPPETLITSMAEHQRYFPVLSEEGGTLLSYFVSVRNGDRQEIDNVVRGNEKVLRARLKDAEFFYDEDRKHSIPFFLEKLETVVFQEKIGTVSQKMQKIKAVAEKINNRLKLDAETKEETLRAAEICKFDLVSDMVNEFPELQGVMGEKYALHYGEKENVAKAIREHYLPAHASGDLPETTAGSIVSVADKLDTIVGCISVGLVPTGSQDPYGLRRQAIGALRIILEQKWDISIEELLEISWGLYGLEDEEIKQSIKRFITDRAAYILTERGIGQDVVQAVLSKEIGVLHYAAERAEMLSGKRNDDGFRNVQEALVRIMNIGKKHAEQHINEALFETDSEKELYSRFEHIKANFLEAEKQHCAKKALNELNELAEPIHAFFDNTMVMADKEEVKKNRLALVHSISKLIERFADMTMIEWKQHQ